MTVEQDRPTALYRFYDENEVLLYVGIAYDPDQRQKGHAQTAKDSWYPLAATRKVEFYDTRTEAEEAEKRIVRSEKPRFNRQYATMLDPEVRAADERREGRVKRAAASTGSTGAPQSTTAFRHLSQKIISGYYVPGDSLPKKADLLKTLGVSSPALSRAYQELENEGFIRKAGIRGYVVLPAEERIVAVRIGYPKEAAAVLREAMSDEQVAALVAALTETPPSP